MQLGLGLWKYKRKLRYFLNLYYMPLQSFKHKVFCISIQRSGTTSVGNFLSDHGYRVARWEDSLDNQWTYKWSIGDYESIFNSVAFRSFNAYEDDPWWASNFYRVLYHRFPKAKFVLLYRDSDSWFDSMMKHSSRKTIGNTYIHCKIYNRLSEFYYNLDNNPDFNPTIKHTDNLLSLDKNLCDHYKKIYEMHTRDTIEFFNTYSPNNFFSCQLEDKLKWHKLGKFLGITVKPSYDVHVNRSPSTE